MEIEEVLINLGLNQKQAKVYLALLQLGSASVPTISVKSGVKRPTAYLILEELRMKELVNLIPKSTKIYTAKSPQILLEEQSEKESEIRAKMPELLAMYNSKKEKPKITYYEGEESIVKLYNQIFKETKIDMYGSIKTISSSKKVEKELENYIKAVRERGALVREVLEADEKAIEYVKRAESKNHQIKIAPKEYQFPTDNIIYGNKLALFSYKDTPQAVVIESSDVVATYKSVFEIMWKSV